MFWNWTSVVDWKLAAFTVASYSADVVWVILIITTARKNRWAAFFAGLVLNQLNARVTSEYVRNELYINVYSIAAAAGVFMAVPLQEWLERRWMKRRCKVCAEKPPLIYFYQGSLMYCYDCRIVHQSNGEILRDDAHHGPVFNADDLLIPLEVALERVRERVASQSLPAGKVLHAVEAFRRPPQNT